MNILATLVYLQKNGKTLMILHAEHKHELYKGKWNGLGGKILEEETPEECAKREVFEESGYKPKELKLLSETHEALRNATSRRAACAACTLFQSCQTPFLKPWVPKQWTGKVLILGEAPERHDEQSHRLFTGPAGILLRTLWREVGFDDDDIALVNTVRCRPVNAKPTMRQIRACRPFVLEVIKQLKPHVVLCCGGIALKCILNAGGTENVTEHRGRVLPVKDIHKSVWVTYHPASVLHGNLHHRERIKEDLTRVSWKPTPWPKDEHPSGLILGFDTEFVEPGPELDPPLASREVLVAALADDTHARTYSLTNKQFIRLIGQAQKLCAHNGACDIDSLVQYGLCKEEWARGVHLRDSLWLSRLADENRGKGGYKLENLFLSRFKTKPWKAKTESYGFDSRVWPSPLRDERCRLDAWASLRLAESFLPEARGQLQLQHRIGLTLHRIYHAGVYIDLDFMKTFAKQVEIKLSRAARALRVTASRYGMTEFDPGNKNHIRSLLIEHVKVPIEERTKTGKASVGKLFLKQHKDQYPEIEDCLEHSKYAKIQNTYVNAIDRLLRPGTEQTLNGRPIQWMPVRINPLGARTLRRSSGADRLSADNEENGLNFQNWTKAVRPLITTRFRNGGIVDNDYHKLEAILQGWLSGEEAMVEFFLET